MEQSLFFIEKISIGLIIFVGIAYFFIKKINEKKKINKSMNYKLLLIKVPKEIFLDKNEPSKKIAEMIANCDQMISNLNKFKHHVVFEIVSPIDSKEISFYVACHRHHIDLIQKMITAFFPFAEVLESNDYTIFAKDHYNCGWVGKLSNNYALPIKTYQNFENDPFSSVLNAFSKIDVNEGMALQIVIEPSDKNVKKEIKKIHNELKKGGKENEVFKKKIFDLNFLTETFKSNESTEKKNQEEKVVDETLVKNVEFKLSQSLFNVNLRVLISSKEKFRVDSLFQEIESGFMQLTSPMFNLIEFKKFAGKKLNNLGFKYIYRVYDVGHKMVLNSSEINSFWHLPHALLEVPGIKWLKARSAPVPANLPEDGVIIGKNVYRSQETLVRMKTKDRRLHTYVIGQTGTGKTTLMKNMIIQDIQDGKGVCFIDPHGDLANEILDMIPEERIDDVVYFNPADHNMSIGLNMIETNPRYPLEQTFIINELLEIMDKLYDLKTTGGPIFEQYMRNALSLLMSDVGQQWTLVEVPRVLIDTDFRNMLLERCTNVIVKDFWEKEASKAEGDLALKNMAPYINSKLAPFLTNDFVRPIIGQRNSTLNFKEIINNKKIFIVNLAKGILGDINAYLLGMIIVGRIALSAFARIEIPEDERQDFYLYIDEFQNITTKTIPQILSEARKFRLSLIIAHQFVAQVKEDIRDAIFGNVGSLVSFRISSQDGELLQKYFTPVFSATDLVGLDNFNAYVRLIIEGQPARAFNIRTIRPEIGEVTFKTRIVEVSNSKYSKPRLEVDADISRRFRKQDLSEKTIKEEKLKSDNDEDIEGEEETDDMSEEDKKILKDFLDSIKS